VAIFDQLVARNPQDLTLQLARASLAYQAKVIPESQAEAVLNYWYRHNRLLMYHLSYLPW
jgi:hypothetical protein